MTNQDSFAELGTKLLEATSTTWRITGTLGGESVTVPFGYSMQRKFMSEGDAVGTLEGNREGLVAEGYEDLKVQKVTSIDFGSVSR